METQKQTLAPAAVEDFLTVSQAAELLKVCSVTVRRMIQSGQLKAYRLFGRGMFRIRVSEFNRVAKQLEMGQQTTETASTQPLEELLK